MRTKVQVIEGYDFYNDSDEWLGRLVWNGKTARLITIRKPSLVKRLRLWLIRHLIPLSWFAIGAFLAGFWLTVSFVIWGK